MNILARVNLLLDRYPMHRVTSVALATMLAYAMVLSLAGVLDYSALDIAGAMALSIAAVLVTNYVLARALRAVSSTESNVITGLIVALIVPIGLSDNAAFLA